METPRDTKLYRRIAKDYQPKQAEMLICKYIEGIEEVIGKLQERVDALESAMTEPKPKARKEKPAETNEL